MKISFYHLTKSALEEALPKLCEKMLETDKNVHLWCKDAEQLEILDKTLWSVGGRRFIPHGTESEDFTEQQPILLTTSEENINKASFLVVTNPLASDEIYKNYERVFIIFSGFSDDHLSASRHLWKKYKNMQNVEIEYFQQDEKGGWQKNS
jgi:DNA polymerase-3 subunit chi